MLGDDSNCIPVYAKMEPPTVGGTYKNIMTGRYELYGKIWEDDDTGLLLYSNINLGLNAFIDLLKVAGDLWDSGLDVDYYEGVH